VAAVRFLDPVIRVAQLLSAEQGPGVVHSPQRAWMLQKQYSTIKLGSVSIIASPNLQRCKDFLQ
jgi:hypothetical protein